MQGSLVTVTAGIVFPFGSRLPVMVALKGIVAFLVHGNHEQVDLTSARIPGDSPALCIPVPTSL